MLVPGGTPGISTKAFLVPVADTATAHGEWHLVAGATLRPRRQPQRLAYCGSTLRLPAPSYKRAASGEGEDK